MGTFYTVKPGDYLSKIAAGHGLAGIGKITQDEHNREFFKTRDPNILYAGDQIYIPDNENKRQEPCETHLKHCFQLVGEKDRIILNFLRDLSQTAPLASYRLKIGDTEYCRSLTDEPYENNLNQGLVSEEIPQHESEAELNIVLQAEPETTYKYHLQIGYMDPITSVTGIQARLNNLGYECGKIDGVPGPKTEKAVKRFQTMHQLPGTGIMDAGTRAKLKESYGS